MSQVKAGGAYVELTTRSSQFLKGLEAAQKRLKSFGASTRLLGTKLTGLGVAAATPVAGSLAVYTSFDDAIRAAGAAANATGETFESLRNTAKHLGATTSFSATEVASLMTELGRAGFSPKQIEEMTLAVMNLARATGTDATLSSGIMAATIRQFSMEASDAVRVADGLTAAANKSFNSVESLGEALSYAGPVASDANMSLEETLARKPWNSRWRSRYRTPSLAHSEHSTVREVPREFGVNSQWKHHRAIACLPQHVECRRQLCNR